MSHIQYVYLPYLRMLASAANLGNWFLRSNIEEQIGRFGLYALLEIHLDVASSRHLSITGNSGHLFVLHHIAWALSTLCIMVLGVENELHQSKDVARSHRPVVHHIMRFHEYFLHIYSIFSFKSISVDLEKDHRMVKTILYNEKRQTILTWTRFLNANRFHGPNAGTRHDACSVHMEW
jgi:hypothetical protein